MARFKYKVRDKFGKVVTGSMESQDKNSVATHLESMGYAPVSISEESKLKNIQVFGSFGRVSSEDMNLFNRQLVTLIKAGLPLLAALNAVEKQTKSRVLRQAIQAIIKDIEGGSSLSEALRRHPSIFKDLYIHTIQAGETSGALDEMFSRLADLGEHEADTISKIKAATRYPVIAVIALISGFMIMITFVIPRFMTIFNRFDTVLPLPTRILIWLNNAIVNYWYIAIVALGVIVFTVRQFIGTPVGRRIWDTIRIRMPVFGPLFLMLTMSRFSRIMAIMLRSGVPILTILEIVANAADNVVISGAIKDIMKSVNQGRGMAEPMARSKVFSTMVVQMVSIGEETGQVDVLLMRVADYYDQQSDFMIKNLTTMLEPILVVILGGAVLVLALAVFLPMWNMISLFRR